MRLGNIFNLSTRGPKTEFGRKSYALFTRHCSKQIPTEFQIRDQLEIDPNFFCFFSFSFFFFLFLFSLSFLSLFSLFLWWMMELGSGWDDGAAAAVTNVNRTRNSKGLDTKTSN